MNKGKNAYIESAPNASCPVTGLPIFRRPEWTDVDFGRDYKLTVGILGDRIILNQPSGYGTLYDIKNALRLMSQAAAEMNNGGLPYVHISDYSKLQNASFKARKYFIDNINFPSTEFFS